MNNGEPKKRVRRGRKKLGKILKRLIRVTTNLNEAEKNVAERNREAYGYLDMGSFIRSSILGVLSPERYENPAINTETSDAMKSSFSCFNQALNIIHANAGLVTEAIMTDLLSKYFAYGEQISKCRQELYGKFDKNTIAHYALALLSSAELQELADKKLVEEELAEELGVKDLEAEYDL